MIDKTDAQRGWHIDSFPWKRGDEYMWYDVGAVKIIGVVAWMMLPEPVTESEWLMCGWRGLWSHRPLSTGLRTQP